MDQLFFNIPISWFTYTLTQKSTLSQITKIPNKINQKSNLVHLPPFIVPHIVKPLIFTTNLLIQSPKLTIKHSKNHPPISISSLLISTFHDTHFLLNFASHILSINTYLLGGTLKPSHYPLSQTTYIIKSNPKIQFNPSPYQFTDQATKIKIYPQNRQFTPQISYDRFIAQQ